MSKKSIKRREKDIEKKEHKIKKEKKQFKEKKRQLKSMRVDFEDERNDFEEKVESFENRKSICPICGDTRVDGECSKCNMRKQALHDIIEIKRQLGDDALLDFDRAEMSLYGLTFTAVGAALVVLVAVLFKCFYMIPVVLVLGLLVAGYVQRIANIKRKWIGAFNKLELSEKFSLDDFMNGTIDKAEERLKTGQADTLFEALS